MTTRAKKSIGVWGSHLGGAFENLDEAVTRREALKLAKEYRAAFGKDWRIVVGVAKPRKNPRELPSADVSRERFSKYLGWARRAVSEIEDDLKAIAIDPLAYMNRWKAIADGFELMRIAATTGKHEALDASEKATGVRPKYPVENPSGGAIAAPRRRRRRRVRANCLGPIAAMQAGRRPRKNPEIVPLAYDPPMPGLKPPRRLALLAELVELVVTTPNGEQRTIRPKPNTAAMLTNSTGDVLWFVWPTKAKRVPMPPGARREKKIFETWSKHKASVALNFSTGEAAWPYEPLGVVRVVRYRSDKWTGEPTLYEHEFTSRGVKAFGDKVKNPKLIVASIPTFDQRQAVTLVTSRGLVG